MRPAIALMFCLCLGSACDKSVYRSAEGQFCSSTDDDDPYYECLLGMGLVCANSYSQAVADNSDTDAGGVRFQPVWVCRQACTPGDSCFQAGDICCKASIFGRSYADRPYVCTPESQCDDKGDAGTKQDARITRDGAADGADGAADAADAGADAADDGAGDALHASPEAGPETGSASPDAGAPDAPLEVDMGQITDSDAGGAG
jgi:hypothetical protein